MNVDYLNLILRVVNNRKVLCGAGTSWDKRNESHGLMNERSISSIKVRRMCLIYGNNLLRAIYVSRAKTITYVTQKLNWKKNISSNDCTKF